MRTHPQWLMDDVQTQRSLRASQQREIECTVGFVIFLIVLALPVPVAILFLLLRGLIF